ncbi:hypothetical protein K432DRAFT_288381 [Lepidopterella palustris CBS 459.81]|uniref:G-protein coupled receptors family 2 profile 2 domain-containing protein n=1 Tax=Lepidopterella palustris CBS 459.81 TaxID=1314670 RepID=A0A8E2JJI5_9PEZI|nr:hypothetical protein K432DRAFT_288381 [Lepidopterella palustris CBS 459.81]
MANTTLLRGLCPAPFFDSAKFSTDGGFIGGRFCAPVPQISADLTCCIPCPATDYLYDDNFQTWYRAAEWINVAGLFFCVFLLLSFLFLPAEKTRRHYLSYCLIVGVMLMALGFVVPLGVQPDQCYDQITPNDMYSNLTCAFSGAFIIAGGLSIDVWVFIRALSMHLQICWDVMPGKKFFYAAQVLGWGVIAVFFTVTITLTGVSFRFGDACHVNSADSMKDFWGPLLAVAGAATLLQLATFFYCIHVYLKNMWSDEKTETQSSAGLPSYTTSSLRTHSARAVYRRVRKVIWLQWRGITIVIFILVDIIFFSVVFVYLNSVESSASKHMDKSMPWIICLVSNPDHREKCFHLGQDLFVNMPTVIAILIMLSFAGIQCFVLLGRASIFKAWYEFLRSKFSSKREFVSLDAKRFSSDARTYELLKVGNPSIKSPETVVTSPAANEFDLIRRSATSTPDYFGKEIQREYRSPTLSFSSPRAPSQAAIRVDLDPRATYARGGLGLHPPVAEDDGMANKI